MRVCDGLRPRTPAFLFAALHQHEATTGVSDVLLEMRGITKEFPGVKALKDVSFSVAPGEIHALVGENGAGKSTLMKVVSGVYPYGSYDGEFFFKGEECRFHNIRESEHKGIVIIHQELALIPHLSITENIFLNNEQATQRRHQLGAVAQQGDGAAQEGRAGRDAGHADPTTRRGQAAAGRDREGAEQERRAPDPRRADRLAERERLPGAAPAPARVPFERDRVRAHLAQAERGRVRRGHDHRDPRRGGDRVARRQGRRGQRGPDHPRHGRARHDPPVPAPRGGDRRGHVRGQELEGPPSALRGPDGHQRRQHQRPQGRGRRHRRPDGRRADRVRDEPVRPLVGPVRLRPGAQGRAGDRRQHDPAGGEERARLRDRGPQDLRPGADQRRQDQHHPRQPQGRVTAPAS